MRRLIPVILSGLLVSCGSDEAVDESPETPAEMVSDSTTARGEPAERKAFFGDLHVHTMYSFDAFIFGTTASPDDAYAFAKGGVVRHPGGFDMKLDEPLDFYAVTDHGFYLGALRAMTDMSTGLSKHELAEEIRNVSDEASRGAAFRTFLSLLRSERRDEILDAQVFKNAWDDIVASANRHYVPGEFTTFIGYEYTSTAADGGNLHRNVFFRGDKAPALPFSRLDSLNPEELWAWMDEQRDAGLESLAIPHNSNGSNGNMFSLLDFSGGPLTAQYAAMRMRNEPLVEITQVKGTSDTHPALSPNDEWAEFEIMPNMVASALKSKPEGSYVREALMHGIEMEVKKDFNPFRFGFAGASDTHNASYAGNEDNYYGKVGVLDDEPQDRGSVPLDTPAADGSRYTAGVRHTYGAAGLTGVWADENNREAIYDAFRRKETFATSGPRIKVRFFAGEDLPGLLTPNLAQRAYESGVSMGGELAAPDASPEFLVWAEQDPLSADLQRVQVVKASVRDGKAQEKVFDAACAIGNVDPETHRCEDNGARVNLADCSVTRGRGAAQLQAVWKDPDYAADEHAIYYVRVLENPTCRWSTWDAIKAGVAPREDLPATIQERAWSSPIWVTPVAR